MAKMNRFELEALITVSKGSVTKQIPKKLEEQYLTNGWSLGKKTVPEPKRRAVRNG